MKLTDEEARWRDRCLTAIRGGALSEATAALLDLTYQEPDREWLQKFLLECTSVAWDPQIRGLAITCLGHVARLDGRINEKVRVRLDELMSDPDLGGRAEDALDDILSFVDSKGQPTVDGTP